MASVSSLDQDMRNLRMSRYTPQAANECRAWIEETLGERLAGGDLLDALKNGVALCQLANLAIPSPGVRFKKSAMPFIQMENISHFLRACESPPLNMPAHDRFLTVDLFESKDPAQVMQCLSAFSRVANATNPAKFPTTIGPKRAGALSPTSTGATSPYVTSKRYSAATPTPKPMSPALTGGSTTSSTQGSVSSWSKRGDESSTNPAWNIAQYGYMGGASQGNQGVAFGARRQITSAGPKVPSLAEKERKRREKEAEDERLRIQAEEAEQKRSIERQADEEREKLEEERRWENETRRARDEERRRIEEQKQQWEEQEQKWKMDEEARLREEAETQRTMGTPGQRPQLKGQFLSQYHAEQAPASPNGHMDTPERKRVRDLEKQLEEARERERQYQMERDERLQRENNSSNSLPAKTETEPKSVPVKATEPSWAPDERESLRQQRQQWQSSEATNIKSAGVGSSRPLPDQSSVATKAPSLPTREVPEPASPPAQPVRPVPETRSQSSMTRPLPDPSGYQPAPQTPNRTDQYLRSNAAPTTQSPNTYQPAEMGHTSTLEQQADTERRIASQQKTKAGGWASKSLLEREMERERERQKEWESAQQATKSAARDMQEGSAPGQSWDVHQYGYTGGDSQNKGSSTGSGIGFGGRRQIIGPRPQP